MRATHSTATRCPSCSAGCAAAAARSCESLDVDMLFQLTIDRWANCMLQIEGRGNGIKTNVVNNAEIAKALERPPDCEH